MRKKISDEAAAGIFARPAESPSKGTARIIDYPFTDPAVRPLTDHLNSIASGSFPQWRKRQKG